MAWREVLTGAPEAADHLFFSKVFLMSRESEKGKIMEKCEKDTLRLEWHFERGGWEMGQQNSCVNNM